jgi:site-specific recombinase XerD
VKRLEQALNDYLRARRSLGYRPRETWAGRLGIVRRYAIWHSANEPRTEIPAGLHPHRYRRKPPHIYSDQEIETLLRRSQQLPSPKRLRPPRPASSILSGREF